MSKTGAGGGGIENPLTIAAGTGVGIIGAGTFDGLSTKTMTFSIGQDVATSSTVQFANVSSSGAVHIGPTSFEISQRDDGKAQVNTDWVVQGNIIAENYIVSSSVTHMTTSFASGSNIFGDSIDDSHRFTGSIDASGSITLNGGAMATTTTITDANLYNRKQFVKKASSITIPSTASFTAVTASAPTGLTATSEDDFVFFINGQYMEHDALAIQQSGSLLHLIVNTDSIGYSLEADDEIIASGKFNS